MKKILIPFILFLGIHLLSAQDDSFQQLLRNPQIEQETREQIVALIQDTEMAIKEANVELNYYKAQLERLLFQKDPDMDEVEQILKSSLEWRLQVELSRIKQRVELRKLLGDNLYSEFLRKRRLEQENKSSQSR